ncbi:MMPL family transporter [Lentzea nigeriaca]|uniref:MMPL family transporter n=1 Tax=Lentzea nigeriaca TaxID=1128665 RepID=UPI00195C71DA|nr:MMPL family transporter [Lentzea nigeriaca]MBM7865009.1 RND superfamily putative drug exporter [Lentzea nigeriaca]
MGTPDCRAAAVVAAVGRASVRHWFVVIGGWVLLVLALVIGAGVIGSPTDNDVSLPGTDAQFVRDLAASGEASLSTGTVILVAKGGRLDGGVLAATAAQLRQAGHVTSVKPPAAKDGSLSADGRTGWFTVGLDVRRAEMTKAMAQSVLDAAEPARDAGVRVLPGGGFAQVMDGSGSTSNEYFGLLLAAAVLFLALGGLLGAVLPLLSAALSVVATLEIVGLAGNLTPMPAQASTLALMIGLGVGIDYSLVLLNRFRTLAREGLSVPDAIEGAAGDSGTAVVIAGVTVAVALASLSLTAVPLLQTLAWTCGIAVFFAVLTALTLLPALTSLAGARLARGGRLHNRLARGTGSGGFWARQADRATRSPWRAGGAAVVLLALLAAPALDLRLGQLDAGSWPEATAVRQADDAISAAFGPGASTPLIVVAQLDTPVSGAHDPRMAPLEAMVRAQSGVASVGPATPSADGRIVTVQVIASTSGGDPATADLVHRLRSQPVPGMTVHVGGNTAARVDLADLVTDKLPLVIGVVLLLSVAVLLFSFRAPLMALKAAVMDLISIGAAYGVLVVVFTWGWGATWIGLSGPVPIPSYVPLMLFALLFGLSMDYEVFLLRDVQRRYRLTHDNLRSVREGLLGTGRVITAAAAIMVGVFLAFVPSNDPAIKMFGVGLAAAIAVDATVVRCLLVPATMAALGDLNWWTPGRKQGRAAVPTTG